MSNKLKILIVLLFCLFFVSCAKKPDSFVYCEERNVGYKNSHTFCIAGLSPEPGKSDQIDILVSWEYKNKIDFLGQELTRMSAFWYVNCSLQIIQLQSVTWYVDISGEITYYVPEQFAEFNNPNPTPEMLAVINGIDNELTPYVEKWFCQK